ncbi:hypothetical protein Zmor_008836 [Zophobas morio]|uniref:Mucin-2 n=2 Tax=cellular organisms TaxID=131567 RepID=A0AA38HJQ7_9CUCU|nr:hypothetical protein Zmor_008836 [Zophobas morio]
MHPKFVAAKNAALGLWVRAGGYAAQHLTDGIVPGAIAKMYGTPGQVRKLVEVGLWHEHGHRCSHAKCLQPGPGDYAIHDYLDYNPTRADVQARREREAEKKRRYRARGEQLPLDEPDRTPPPPPRPRRDDAGPIPAGWQPTDADVEAAQLARADAGLPQLTPQQLDTVTRRFVRRMTDDQVRAAAWGGRWQGWVERERTEPAPASPGGTVLQHPAMTKSQQQRAGLDRLRQNGGHSA